MNLLIIQQAIIGNDMEKFARIVEENAGILEQRFDESLDTVLHIATRYGNVGLVAKILRTCPLMAAEENRRGETALHEACRLGHDKIVMMLLETDPWVASKLNSQGQSPLYLACCYGRVKAASIFLNQPWLQELDDGEGSMFLHVAASEGHIAIVRKILERHPSTAEKLDKNGYSALHHACSRGHAEITAMLLSFDPQRAYRFSRNGYAPAHLAAMNGNTEVLKQLLLAAPTCFKLLSRKGETVFHLAVKFDRFDAFVYLAQVLENTRLFYQPDNKGDTCLHLAISGGNHNIAEYIIKEGGELINCWNFRGDTAMDLLERAGDSLSIQNLRVMLEAAGAKRNGERSSSTENVDIISTELLTLQDPPDENICTDLKLTTPSGRSSQTNTEPGVQSDNLVSSSDTPVANPGPVLPRFGEWSDQEIQSRRKKRSRNRLCQYKQQSEKSRRNLMKIYQKQHKRHELYREALHNARETITLVAVLIATITYTGGINPPGGVYQDGPLRGTAVAARRTAFKVFSVCNNVALFASLCIVIVFVSIVPFRRKPLMMMLMVAHKAMWVAVGFMATAYFAASVVLMPPRHGWGMDWTAVSLLSISAGTLGSVFVALGFMLMRHHLKKLRYRKKVAASPGHVEIGKDSCPEADKNSVQETGHSINSDMDISMIFGYHPY